MAGRSEMGVTLQAPGPNPPRSFAPPDDLSDILENVWAVDLAHVSTPACVIPDPNFELVMIVRNDAAPRFLVTGPLHATTLEPSKGFVVGAGLHPSAAGAFLRCDAREFLGSAVSGTELGWGTALQWPEQLNPENAVRSMISLVRRRRETMEIRGDPLVSAAVRRLSAGGGCDSIASLAAALDASERNLRRKFKACAAIGPKTAARLYRVKRALRALFDPSQPSLAEVAASHGYCDQSHLSLEIREWTGLAPAELRRRFLTE